jgi:hypothetical protein
MSVDADRTQLHQNPLPRPSHPRTRLSRRGWAATVVAVMFTATVATTITMVPADLAAKGAADADIYSAPGSHAVGTRVVTLDDTPPVNATAWYPARQDRRSDARVASYPYGISIADAFGTTTIGAFGQIGRGTRRRRVRRRVTSA